MTAGLQESVLGGKALPTARSEKVLAQIVCVVSLRPGRVVGIEAHELWPFRAEVVVEEVMDEERSGASYG